MCVTQGRRSHFKAKAKKSSHSIFNFFLDENRTLPGSQIWDHYRFEMVHFFHFFFFCSAPSGREKLFEFFDKSSFCHIQILPYSSNGSFTNESSPANRHKRNGGKLLFSISKHGSLVGDSPFLKLLSNFSLILESTLKTITLVIMTPL